VTCVTAKMKEALPSALLVANWAESKVDMSVAYQNQPEGKEEISFVRHISFFV